MLLLNTCLVFILLVCVSREVHTSGDGCLAEDNSEPWSYHGTDNGPASWGNRYPNCNGKEQSPIDIRTRNVDKQTDVGNIEFVNYNIPVTQWTVVNNGHTVQMTPTDGVVRFIKLLEEQYNLVQFHAHWGKNRGQGSEHQINGEKFSMEWHFVHSNANGSLAVLGVLYEQSFLSSRFLEPITKVLESVEYKGDRTNSTTNMKLESMFPGRKPFYRYSGSLTTPPCDEGVIWSVFSQRMHISKKHIECFRKLYRTEKSDSAEGCRLVDNFRPVQPLNDRKVICQN